MKTAVTVFPALECGLPGLAGENHICSINLVYLLVFSSAFSYILNSILINEGDGMLGKLFGKGNRDQNARSNAIPYGSQKIDDSHDHRGNKGTDRTPAQKAGDKKRSKP